MISDKIKMDLLNSKFSSLLNSEKGNDVTIGDLQTMNDIKENEDKMEEIKMKRFTESNKINVTNNNDDYYLDSDFPIEDLDVSIKDLAEDAPMIPMDELEKLCDNPTENDKIEIPSIDVDEYDEDEMIKQQIEIEMEKKRKYNVNQIMNSRVGNMICNYKCSAYTIRTNGYCSICDKKCNGYIESESVTPAKMVDIGALCIMDRKDPKVMYVSAKDIENLVNGNMALVTEDGTCVVFDNRR